MSYNASKIYIKPDIKMENGMRELALEIQAREELPFGEMDEEIRVVTDDAHCPIRILRIHGRRTMPIEISTDSLALEPAVGGEMYGTVDITSQAPNLEILNVAHSSVVRSEVHVKSSDRVSISFQIDHLTRPGVFVEDATITAKSGLYEKVFTIGLVAWGKNEN